MSVWKLFKKFLAKLYRFLYNPPNDFLFTLRYKFYNKLIVSISGKELQFSTNDRIQKKWFFPRYLDGSIHEPPVTLQLIKEFKSSTVFFDIGANLGFFTILGQVFCTEGEVHSFEMDPELIGLIKKSVELNRSKSSSKVIINCFAVTDKLGNLERFSSIQEDNKSTNSLFSDEFGIIQIPTLSIDDYCRINNVVPEIIKIDVEGAETLVLRGMTKTLEQTELRSVFLEIHPRQDVKSDSKYALSFISDLMRKNGFNMYEFIDRRDKEVDQIQKINDLESITRNDMIFCKR